VMTLVGHYVIKRSTRHRAAEYEFGLGNMPQKLMESTMKNRPPAKAVRLSDVTEALELMPEEWSAYVNRKTGEVVSLSSDAFAAIGAEDSDEEFFGEADETMVALAREIENGNDFQRLPNKFEVHEWSIMRDFCDSVEKASDRQELLEAVHGNGAFRFFRSTLDRLGLRDKWYRYRDKAIEQIAIDWLEAHDIPWTRTDSGDGILPD
jgi:hypothetical protein